MTLSRRKLFGVAIPLGLASLIAPKKSLANREVVSTKAEPDLDDFKSNNIVSITTVSPLGFGGKKSHPEIDNTQAILQAIQFAVDNQLALDLRGGPWRVTKSLNLTNVRQVITDWTGRLIVNSNDFFDANKFVVYFGKPDVDFHENRALYNSVIGCFLIISENRDSQLNGFYIKGNFLSFDSIRAINLNGTGIHISATWDSTFTSLSAELCGNERNYQICIDDGGDTSNCLSISRIQSERAYHKCLAISCIRSVINAVHAERTRILTENDGTKSLISGLLYSNVIINVGNTTINQFMHDCLPSKNYSSVILNLDQSSIRDAQFSTCIVVSNFGRCSSFENISMLKYYTGIGLKDCSFKNIRIIDSFYPLSNINISGGVYKNVVVNNGERVIFSQSRIYSLSVSRKSKSTFFSNCVFINDLNFGNSADNLSEKKASIDLNISPIIFSDCIFNGVVRGGENAIAAFKGGVMEKVKLKNRTKFIFSDVTIKDFDFDGEALYLTKNCKFGQVHAWSTPNNDEAYPNGTITEYQDDKENHQYVYNAVTKKWINQ
ncbi:hypothetical protein MWG98_05855 [Klebsiella quasipneumoniae]|uniref:Uncharacterized protein n=1 Tax=Klebsiella sp. 708 TaxID=97470 RepID=A0A0N7KWK9_9ENTR|nr:hypothetical protein [Klebsiella quasipneumoniae]MCJ8555654.1 hypothetical protein [Klebsiella quasipneumoniae]BAT24409.1 hypothetical protein [Klebsiella sp. 708]VEB72024.1 Uncharacterised protein [Klebsiella quasipneumoniae]